jgi:RNA polymerase sigma-70 factor (ECF subfamily)
VNDGALVEGLRRGDRRAFDEVHARYRPRLFGFLLRLAVRRDVAEDLLQEAWLKAARAAPRLREDTDLAAWLFTIARNAYRSYRRWALLDISRLVALAEDAPFASELPGPERRAEGAREMERLERALLAVSPAHREVLLLVGVEGMDQERAAEVLGIGYPTLRQRLARARAALERAMQVEGVGSMASEVGDGA